MARVGPIGSWHVVEGQGPLEELPIFEVEKVKISLLIPIHDPLILACSLGWGVLSMTFNNVKNRRSIMAI